MYKNVTIGADPELFVNDGSQIISAEGLIGGTKNNPKPVLNKEGYFVQEDNVMVEFNIPPCVSEKEFLNNIQLVLDYLNIYLKLNNKNHKLDFSTTHTFKKEELTSRQARMFGCDPDFNVYTFEQNQLQFSEDYTTRMCGGHIHIGYTSPNDLANMRLVKALDITLGLLALVIDPDKERKQYYGQLGNYRDKFYGLEYRTLSNFWLKTKELQTTIFVNTLAAIELASFPYFKELQYKHENAILNAHEMSNEEILELRKSIIEESNILIK